MINGESIAMFHNNPISEGYEPTVVAIIIVFIANQLVAALRIAELKRLTGNHGSSVGLAATTTGSLCLGIQDGGESWWILVDSRFYTFPSWG